MNQAVTCEEKSILSQDIHTLTNPNGKGYHVLTQILDKIQMEKEQLESSQYRHHIDSWDKDWDRSYD